MACGAAAGAPMSFAALTARSPAVVNISTKQTIRVSQSNNQLPPGFEEFFRQFGAPVPDQDDNGGSGGSGGGSGPVTQRGGSLGSGFLISPDGYVVTNNHVISPARTGATVEEITVTLADRREYRARVVGRDQVADLALLKINATDLPFVRFGDSTRMRVGDWVWRSAIRSASAARDRGHRLGAAPQPQQRRLRPLHPDRRVDQHGQLAAARCSI